MTDTISREEISRILKERPEIAKLFKFIMLQPKDKQGQYAEIARKYIESKTNHV